MRLPNYQNSNLNLVVSILKHYNVDITRQGINAIDELLKKSKYKKIVLLVMDGMGHHNLLNHNPNSFLVMNNLGPISTIFPSTTAAVMTMYESAKTVYESNWVSWSTYFKSINKSIDVFTGRESLTQEEVSYPYKDLIKYKSIYKMIREKNENLDIYQIYPEKINKEKEPCFQLKYDSMTKLFDLLNKLIIDENEKFVFAYCDQPDTIMHQYGPSSKENNLIMDEIDDYIHLLSKNIDSETLVIVSADHGQVNVEKTYYLNEYNDLMKMLVLPPLLEGRVRSFFVKNEFLGSFKELFNKYFSNEFVLYTRDEVLTMKLFGDGEEHELFIDSIGDYVAIAIKNSIFDYDISLSNEDKFVFKGHHAGLAKEEMEVPLIVLKKDD